MPKSDKREEPRNTRHFQNCWSLCASWVFGEAASRITSMRRETEAHLIRPPRRSLKYAQSGQTSNHKNRQGGRINVGPLARCSANEKKAIKGQNLAEQPEHVPSSRTLDALPMIIPAFHDVTSLHRDPQVSRTYADHSQYDKPSRCMHYSSSKYNSLRHLFFGLLTLHHLIFWRRTPTFLLTLLPCCLHDIVDAKEHAGSL